MEQTYERWAVIDRHHYAYAKALFFHYPPQPIFSEQGFSPACIFLCAQCINMRGLIPSLADTSASSSPIKQF